MIVGIDTSFDTTRLYIKNRKIEKLFEKTGARAHASTLAWFCRQCREVAPELVFYIMGPGSFTGLRTGCAFSSALALSSNAKMVPAPSPALWAYAKREERVAVVQKARASDFFVTLYNEELKRVGGYKVVPKSYLREFLQKWAAGYRIVEHPPSGYEFVNFVNDWCSFMKSEGLLLDPTSPVLLYLLPPQVKIDTSKKKNIALVGFMGSGKTTVGRLLAERLKMKFVEMDSEIEKRAGMSISEIFKEKGEGFFRKLERELLEEILKNSGQVIATGGGVMVYNHRLLLEKAWVFYLEVFPSKVLERIGNDTTRPLLMVENKKERIASLLSQRLPFYFKADVIIDTNNKRVEDVVDEIAKEIEFLRIFG